MDMELPMIGASTASVEFVSIDIPADIPVGEDAIAEVRRGWPFFSLLIQNRLARDTGEGEADDEVVRKVLGGSAVMMGGLFAVSIGSILAIHGGYDQTSGEPVRMGETSVQMGVAFNSFAVVIAVFVLVSQVLGSARILWLKMMIMPGAVVTLLSSVSILLGFLDL